MKTTPRAEHASTLAIHKDEFSVPLIHIQQFHQIARRAGAQMVMAAVFAGLELLRLQKDVGKSPSGWTFEQFLSNRQEELGFGRSTAFKYTALASGMKSKLLKDHNAAITKLLDKAPSAMSDTEAQKLAEAVTKSVDGTSLSELYEDWGIARRKHKAPDRLAGPQGGKVPGMDVPLAQQVQEEMDFFAEVTQRLEKTVKIGNDHVLLLSHAPLDQLDTLIAMHKRNLTLLVKAKQARSAQ